MTTKLLQFVNEKQSMPKKRTSKIRLEDFNEIYNHFNEKEARKLQIEESSRIKEKEEQLKEKEKKIEEIALQKAREKAEIELKETKKKIKENE